MAALGGEGDWHLVREESGETLALSLDGEKDAKHRLNVKGRAHSLSYKWA